MIKRYREAIIIFLLLGLILMTIRRQYVIKEVHNNIENEAFDGIIEGITIGSRDAPIFIVSRKEVDLGGYGHNLKDHLDIGDSVYKQQGNSNVVIIKYYYHDTVMVDVLDNSNSNTEIPN